MSPPTTSTRRRPPGRPGAASRPCCTSPPATSASAHPLTLKLELLQHVGSFKPRGAFNRVLAAARRRSPPRASWPPAAATTARRWRSSARVARPPRRGVRAVQQPGDEARPHRRARRRRCTWSTASTTTPRSPPPSTRNAPARWPCTRSNIPRGGRPGHHGRELERQFDAFDTVLVATRRRRLHRRPGRVVRRPQAGGQRRARDQPVPARGAHGRPAGARVAWPASPAIRWAPANWARWRGAWSVTTSPHSVDGHRRRHPRCPTPAVGPHAAGRRAGRRHGLAALLSGAYSPEPDERVVVVVCGSNCDPNHRPTVR